MATETRATVTYRTLLSPLRFLERSADVFRDKPAVVHADRSYSYAQLLARCRRLANALRHAGVEPGDRVAFLCPNTPEMLEAHYGVPMAGGILVAINTRLSSEEIAYILNHSGSRLLVVHRDLAHVVEPIRDVLDHTRTFVTVTDAAEPELLPGASYEAFLATGSEDPLPDFLEDEEQTISINYTSGTTGRPKGVMYTYRGAYLNALGEVIEAGLTSDSVYLWTLPMFHCNGWCYTWAVTAVGGTHVCLDKFEPATAWSIIQQRAVSHFCGAPTVLIALANDPAAHSAKLQRPLTVVTAAAPPSPTIIGQMEALGARIIHVYGLTETYGPYTVCEWQSRWDALEPPQRARLKARQGVGYVVADRVRVVDEQMNDVPADGETMGEVVMHGNDVMKGYFDQPEATAEAFRGGWFHSGDLGVMHPDGYIELRDRAKDIIISGGENISTIEIERVIAGHPDVLEVAIVGVPDEKWGEVPKAFVVPKPGANPSAEAIIAYCRQHLAHFKCPKHVELGELPKTSTGKVQKYVLREREWKGFESRIYGGGGKQPTTGDDR